MYVKLCKFIYVAYPILICEYNFNLINEYLVFNFIHRIHHIGKVYYVLPLATTTYLP